MQRGTAVAEEVLELEPFYDDQVKHGHHPRSLYVERFWLPILGPGTTLLIRQVALRLENGERRCERAELATSLGLGDGSARQAAFARCLERAAHFDLVRIGAPARLGVRVLLPSISPRHRQRLGERLRALETEMARSALYLDDVLDAARAAGAKRPAR